MNLTHSVLCLLNEDAKEVSLYYVYYLYDQSENKKFLIHFYKFANKSTSGQKKFDGYLNSTMTNLYNFNTSISEN